MSISGIVVAVVVLLEGACTVKLQIVKFSCGSRRQIKQRQVVRKIRRRVSLRVAAVIDPLKASPALHCRRSVSIEFDNDNMAAASATEVRNKVRDKLSRLTLRSSLRNPHPPRRNLKRCNRITPEARNAGP
jgi:hypothetical protein